MAGFAVAMKGYFGIEEGKTIRDFAAELRELTFEDKMEFAAGLRKNGIECDDPVRAASE